MLLVVFGVAGQCTTHAVVAVGVDTPCSIPQHHRSNVLYCSASSLHSLHHIQLLLSLHIMYTYTVLVCGITAISTNTSITTSSKISYSM